MKLSEKLKQLRFLENLTQEQMAKKIGISFPTYNRLENGNSKASLKTIKKLSDFLGKDYKKIRSLLNENNK